MNVNLGFSVVKLTPAKGFNLKGCHCSCTKVSTKPSIVSKHNMVQMRFFMRFLWLDLLGQK